MSAHTLQRDMHIEYRPAAGSQGALQAQSGADNARPMAVMATEQMLADPMTREMVKQQALQLGGQAIVVVQHYGHKGMLTFQEYIEQGPKGISTLCFLGGCATSVCGGLSVTNLLGGAVDPFHYILCAYMFLFGIVTAVIEADTDRFGTMMSPFDGLAEPIHRAQGWLHAECRLLTELRGRGLFYLYQGTLMATQCMFCFFFIAGAYNVFMGVLCIMMSFGIKPDFDAISKSGIFRPGDEYQQVQQELVEEGNLGGVPIIKANNSRSVLPPGQAPVEQEFAQVVTEWKENKERFPGKACRELWAFHRQATDGDCNEPKPTGMFNGNAKEQWRLWDKMKGISQYEAKVMFVDRLRIERHRFQK